MAYQIAFDLYESATQQFLGSVMQALRLTAPLPSVLEEKMKPKTSTPEVPAAAAADQPETTETKTEVKTEKVERTLESLVMKLKLNACFFMVILYLFIFFRVKVRGNTKTA